MRRKSKKALIAGENAAWRGEENIGESSIENKRKWQQPASVSRKWWRQHQRNGGGKAAKAWPGWRNEAAWRQSAESVAKKRNKRKQRKYLKNNQRKNGGVAQHENKRRKAAAKINNENNESNERKCQWRGNGEASE